MLGQGPEIQFQPGTLLANRYEVVRFLSAGGMGSVVLVRDKSLQNALLALKFLHVSESLDEQQFLRFQNEALLMRELNHPHIVHIYDFGCIDNYYYYLSMEYVPGKTLGQIIRENPDGLEFKQALEILYQISIALSFAHGRGIVHRDLKPDNILLDHDGDVRLTDFGLGKAIKTDFNLTDTGQAVGTPHYMAPEQLRGERANLQTDMYAFGLVAYELVTGQKAYNAETYLGLAQKHLSEPIPQFASKRSGIPRWFQDFVEKCAAKQHSARFANFADIAEVVAANIPATKRSLSLEPHVYTSSGNLTHWRVLWQLRKPKRLLIILSACAFIVSSIILLLVGRNNQAIRRHYGPYVYKAERALGIDSPLLRVVLLGRRYEQATMSLTTLIAAVEKSDTDKIEVLLAAGLSPNARTAEGSTLVQHAIKYGQSRALDALASSGANLTVEDEKRRNPLILATLSGRVDMVATVVQHANERTFNIDARDSDRKTALHYATQIADVAIVDYLLKEGASAHLFDRHGTSPLMYASYSGNPEIMERILTKTGSGGINLINDAGWTALHFAASSGSAKACKMLLNYGADPKLKTAEGETPAQLAKGHGFQELAQVLARAR